MIEAGKSRCCTHGPCRPANVAFLTRRGVLARNSHRSKQAANERPRVGRACSICCTTMLEGTCRDHGCRPESRRGTAPLLAHIHATRYSAKPGGKLAADWEAPGCQLALRSVAVAPKDTIVGLLGREPARTRAGQSCRSTRLGSICSCMQDPDACHASINSSSLVRSFEAVARPSTLRSRADISQSSGRRSGPCALMLHCQ